MSSIQKRILFLLNKVEDQRKLVNRERRTMSLYHTELRSLLALQAARTRKAAA